MKVWRYYLRLSLQLFLVFVTVFSAVFYSLGIKSNAAAISDLDDMGVVDESNIDTLDLNDEDIADGLVHVRRGFYGWSDSLQKYPDTPLKRIDYTSNSLNGIDRYQITNNDNAGLDFYEYLFFENTNNTSLVNKGYDVRFEFFNVYSKLYSYKISTGSQFFGKGLQKDILTRYSVRVWDSQGNLYTSNEATVEFTNAALDNSSVGNYSMVINMPAFDFDVYRIAVIFHYDLLEAFGVTNNKYTDLNEYNLFLEFGFNGGSMSAEISKEDESIGFLKSIIDFLIAIKDGILNLPSLIAQALTSLFNMVVNAITTLGNFLIDGIKGLFVPDQEDMQSNFARLDQFFNETFGFLYYPFDFLIDAVNVFLSADSDTGLTFPGFSIMGYQVWSEQTFDLTSIAVVNTIFDMVRLATGGILAFAFINYLRNFFDKRFGGGGA